MSTCQRIWRTAMASFKALSSSSCVARSFNRATYLVKGANGVLQKAQRVVCFGNDGKTAAALTLKLAFHPQQLRPLRLQHELPWKRFVLKKKPTKQSGESPPSHNLAIAAAPGTRTTNKQIIQLRVLTCDALCRSAKSAEKWSKVHAQK